MIEDQIIVTVNKTTIVRFGNLNRGDSKKVFMKRIIINNSTMNLVSVSFINPRISRLPATKGTVTITINNLCWAEFLKALNIPGAKIKPNIP
ncbi:hypothetical protein MASR1M107_28570 [Ignavibacteriales bacterium]